MEFSNALVSQVTFPTFDVSAKEAAYVELTLAPESTRTVDVKGEKLTLQTKAQKKGLLANFRLSIGGLEAACSKVRKIDALTIKQSVQTEGVGSARELTREAGKLEIPSLVVTVPMNHATPFLEWHESFVILGKSGDEQEREGSLELLTPDLKETLLTLNFSHLGIFAVSAPPTEANADQIAVLKAEMYCEAMSLTAPAKL
jgi:hypothetical protein